MGGGCNSSLAVADQKTFFSLDLAQESTEYPRAIPVSGRPGRLQDWQHHTASLWLYTTWHKGSMVNSAAFTLFFHFSVCLLWICNKSILVAHTSPAKLTRTTEMPMNTVLVILLCALSPSHFKSAWDHQETADRHQKHHQVTTSLARIIDLELCIHSWHQNWKNQEMPEECVAASMNSPILVKWCTVGKPNFPTYLLWCCKINVLQYLYVVVFPLVLPWVKNEIQAFFC